MEIVESSIGEILTRACGYLRTVCSHSAQPYRGCALGNSLCGAGCYVQHNMYVTRGRAWGSFLEVRTGAADSYRRSAARERRWARANRGAFAVYVSSSTEPFQPIEPRLGVTRRLLEAMRDDPPDALVLQTHSHRVTEYLELYRELAARCALRVHVSIETDREEFPGLAPHASRVAQRFEAAEKLKAAGITTWITVSPLLPIADPERFFARVHAAADAVVVDHFIGGDGSSNGSRTQRTQLPAAIAALDPEALTLDYRDRMVAVAARHLPGRVGVGCDGFAGRFLR